MRGRKFSGSTSCTSGKEGYHRRKGNAEVPGGRRDEGGKEGHARRAPLLQKTQRLALVMNDGAAAARQCSALQDE